ncbi:MAG: phage holin family protein [Lachnospiraceae bacterium]|nr:phage holin family protein [Lachnospiraceae bacterium]
MKDFLFQLLGETDNLIYALSVFVVMNYITAILVAIVEKKWLKGKLGLTAIFRKIGIIVLICIANIIDTMIVDNDSTIRTVVISFYLSKEGVAILDNLERLGVPLPPIIVKVIKQLNTEESSD